MAPLPVIDNTFRVTINYSQHEGISPKNVWHVKTTTSDVPAIGAAIIAAADQKLLMQGMNPAYDPLSMDIIPLDGTSATQQVAIPTGTFQTTATGQVIPEACAVVSLKTLLRGPANRGRVFIGPLCEETVDAGVLQGGTVADLGGAWADFASVLFTGTPSVALAVASYVPGDAHATNISSINVSSAMATQRRRLLQTR